MQRQFQLPTSRPLQWHPLTVKVLSHSIVPSPSGPAAYPADARSFYAMQRCWNVTESQRFIGALFTAGEGPASPTHWETQWSGSAGIGICFSHCSMPVGNTVQHNLAHTNKPNDTIWKKYPREVLVSKYPVQQLPPPFNLISLGLYFLHPLLSTVLAITA